MTQTRDEQRNEFISLFISQRLAAYNGRRGEGMIRHIDAELQGLKDLALQMGACVEKAL